MTKTPLELLEEQPRRQPFQPAQDVVDGVLYYGLPVRDDVLFVTSERQLFTIASLPAEMTPRHRDVRTSTVSRDAVRRWMASDTVCVSAVLDGLHTFLRRYIVLPDARSATWVAAWTLGTWFYRAFPVFPYLSVRSATKRCGKSLLLYLESKLCFNASAVLSHPTEAQLYRWPARTGGTQIFDEVERLQGETASGLVAVLNAGFQKGGAVMRVERHGDRFVDVDYEIFSPKILAGIRTLPDTVEDRALPVWMVRRSRDENISRITGAMEAEAGRLRDEAALASLSYFRELTWAYGKAIATLQQTPLDDRAVDLWAPIVAICLYADLEDGGGRTADVLAVALQLAESRTADAESSGTMKLIDALQAIRYTQGEKVTPGQLVEALKARPGFEWVRSTKALAGLLNPLGLYRRRVRTGSPESQRPYFYELLPEVIADLRSRYGSSPDMESAGPNDD